MTPINAVVIRSVDGSMFGYMVFEDGKCVQSLEPSVTKEKAQEMLDDWLTKARRAKSRYSITGSGLCANVSRKNLLVGKSSFYMIWNRRQ